MQQPRRNESPLEGTYCLNPAARLVMIVIRDLTISKWRFVGSWVIFDQLSNRSLPGLSSARPLFAVSLAQRRFSMTRASITSLLAVSLLIASCQSPSSSGGGGVASGSSGVGPGDPEPPALFEVDVPAFAVIVSADRGIGVPGTPFKLDAAIAANASTASSFSWSINGGSSASSDPSPEFTFDEPGDYLVDVSVQNDQGTAVTDGVLIKVFEPGQTAATTAQISPASGMPSTFVQIKSPALDDPQASIQVMVAEGDPFEPFRPELGTANLLIPLDAADNITGPVAIQIKLLADGALVDTFDFSLSPPPTLIDPPGMIVTTALGIGPDLLAEAEDNLVEFLSGIEADLLPEEQALVQAFLRFPKARYEQVRDAFAPLMGGMDASTRTIVDQAMIANGITLADLEDLAPQSKAFRFAKNSNDELIDNLCKFHDLVDRIQVIAKGLSYAAQVLNAVGVATAGTPAGLPTIAAANVIGELTRAAKFLMLLSDLVPRVSDDLLVTAIPNVLMLDSDKAIVQVKARLTKSDGCQRANTANSLIDFAADEIAKLLAEDLVDRIASRTFGRQNFRRTLRTSRNDSAAVDEAINQIKRFLAAIVADIIKANEDVFVLDALIKPIIDKICATRDSDTLELQPEEMILTQSPDNVGRFLNLQEESIDFFCNPNSPRSVTIKVERECGLTVFGQSGARKLTGETTITCGLESCMEDASGSIDVQVIRTEFHDNPSTFCLNVAETLKRQDAILQIKNMHTTRTVKIAAVSYATSDRRLIVRGPCNVGNLPAGQTEKECIESTAAGCDHALSGPSVGFSSFLLPGETTLPVPFICEQEFIFSPPMGDITCVDDLLETVEESWVIQAVFCDNNENAEQFCTQMDTSMKKFGQGGNVNTWLPKETEGCSSMKPAAPPANDP